MQSSISKRFSTTILRASVALSMVAITFPAHAELERVGPTSNSPQIGGFPAWYQDKTGIAIEFCAPMNQAEVDGGHCNVLTGDVFPPESFPTNFFDEHFYFAAGANMVPASGGRALLVLATESAFMTSVKQADQIMFSRIRIRLEPAPATGTYRFIHPYGEEIVEAAAGDRIFNTDDVGIQGPVGDFSGAMHSRVGPFLLASDTPGGAELPAVTGPVPGKLYIADPGRLGPVTGSTLPDFVDSTGASRNHNIFRIEGPLGSALGGVNPDGSTIDFIETTDFSLIGRLFTESIAGRVSTDRASYTNNASARKLDVFASGFQTTQGRLPASPRPAPVLPQLSYYEAACGAGAAGALSAPARPERQMISAGTSFWAQSSPAAIPSAVCVKDASARNAVGQLVPAFFQADVTDEVAVTQATFDPAARTLTVKASSSDSITPPALKLDAFDRPLTAGQVTITGLDAPPAKVRVVSSRNGSTELAVTTSIGNVTPPASLTAVNDSFTFAEDSGAQRLVVLANDVAATGGRVTLASQPRLGTATVLADGSVNYTPNLNAFGNDAFTYTVTVGTGAPSNIANAAITLTAVNDLSTAVNDGTFTVNTGAATALPNLLTNDLDPDGATDMTNAVIVSQPAGATVSGGAGGVVRFNTATEGTYTFTYRTQDSAGALSANAATVTVNAVNADVVVISSALFRNDKKRWTVTGTSSVPNQTISLTYDNGAAAGYEFGTVQVDGTGAWTLDIRGVSGTDDPTTLNPRPTRIRATSSLTGSGTIGLTVR